MTIKELREKRAKLVADARALFESIKTDTPETEAKEIEAKFDAMMGEADKLKERIDREDRLLASEAHLNQRQEITAAVRRVSVGEVDEDESAQNAAFSAYLRRGMNGLTEEQRAIALPRFHDAQSTGVDTAGGYTAPAGFYGQIESAELAYGGMLEPGVCFVFNTDTGNALPIPTDNDTTNAGTLLQENTQVGEQDVTFGNVTLNAYTYSSKMIRVSNQLLRDSAFNFDAFIAGKLGTRIARIVNTHLTTGDASSKPNGVVPAATLGKAGATGQTTSIIWDDLTDLAHSVDPSYRRTARYMMADSSVKVLRKLKDGEGRLYWQQNPIVGAPDLINGYPFTVNQDMAAMAASAKSILFGDFSKYFVRRVVGVQVLRLVERFADFNQVAFVAFQSWDGNLVDAGTHPIKYYQNSAS